MDKPSFSDFSEWNSIPAPPFRHMLTGGFNAVSDSSALACHGLEQKSIYSGFNVIPDVEDGHDALKPERPQSVMIEAVSAPYPIYLFEMRIAKGGD